LGPATAGSFFCAPVLPAPGVAASMGKRRLCPPTRRACIAHRDRWSKRHRADKIIDSGHAQADRPRSGARPQAAVRLKATGEPETTLQNAEHHVKTREIDYSNQFQYSRVKNPQQRTAAAPKFNKSLELHDEFIQSFCVRSRRAVRIRRSYLLSFEKGAQFGKPV
jgi:hypothetical protein